MLLVLGAYLDTAAAGDLERRQAQRLHDRIAGVPPSASVLDAMEQHLIDGNSSAAAALALDNNAFYNVTLKNFATPMTNEEQTVFAPLNDYTATIIGLVRDDLPYTEVLSADILYVGASALGLPAYSTGNNDHYAQMDERGIDLKTGLVRSTQSSLTGLPPQASAGVMTTRAAAKAFFIDGTNRAMFRFTMMNHLCKDMEQVKDPTRPHDRIRQDVSRSPGGDSRIFLNNCAGCHAGLDPMAQAYAFYQYEYDSDADPDGVSGRLVYTPGLVQPKYHINANNFKHGYVTANDRWDNYWRQGPNALLGWSAGSGGGNGAKSLGVELAGSDAFARCQVEKVFKAVCFRTPGDSNDRTRVDNLITSFKGGNYSLKKLFGEAAVYCMGD